MVQIYTGNGKGKTTASLGISIRALGRNHKVCLIQFMKKNFEYGEIQFLEKQEGITIHQYGTDKLINPNAPAQIDFDEAEKAAIKAYEMISSNNFDLIVIDEINVAVAWKLIPLQKQLDLMDLAKKHKAEVVMTGRYATEEAIRNADLVTEMKEIKHYFNAGVNARMGIEF